MPQFTQCCNLSILTCCFKSRDRFQPIRVLKFRLKVHWGWIFFIEKSLGPCLLAVDKNYFAPFSLKKKFKRKKYFRWKNSRWRIFFFTKINRQKNSTKVVLVGSFFHWFGVSDLPFLCSLLTILAFLHACNKPKEQKDHIDNALVYLFYYAQITFITCKLVQFNFTSHTCKIFL